MATGPARRSTRAARSSRSSSGRHQRGVGRFDAEGRRNFDVHNHKPAQRWVSVKRPPAPGVGFAVKVWVPVDDLTEEESKELFPSEEVVKQATTTTEPSGSSDGGAATSMQVETAAKTDKNVNQEKVSIASSIDIAEKTDAADTADTILHAMTESHPTEVVREEAANMTMSTESTTTTTVAAATPISSSAIDAATNPNASLPKQSDSELSAVPNDEHSQMDNVKAPTEIAGLKGQENTPTVTTEVDAKIASIAPEADSLTMATSSLPKKDESMIADTAEALSSIDPSTTQTPPESASAEVNAVTLQQTAAQQQMMTTTTTTIETEVQSNNSCGNAEDGARPTKRPRLSENNEEKELV